MYRLGIAYIHRTASIKGNVTYGKSFYAGPFTQICAGDNGNIIIGKHSTVEQGAILDSFGGSITIGDYTSINPYCILYGHGGLKIGNNVAIATHCVFIPANHNFDSFDTPIKDQGLNCNGIIIEDNVWFGAHCTILDGVTVHSGAIIGAGAVVSHDIPTNAVAVGVPARVIKIRRAR